MSLDDDDDIKSTVSLIFDNTNISQNNNISNNSDNLKNDIKKVKPKKIKRNIDINADPMEIKNDSINNSRLINKEELENSNKFSNENSILNIVNDINKTFKDIQIIPLHIQKGNEKKYLLVKKNMTLKDILFINFKFIDVEKTTFYIGKKKVCMDKTIGNQNIEPLSFIRDYPE